MEEKPSVEEQQLYMQQLQDNYQNPQNFKKLKDYTLFSHAKNASCGDIFDLYIKLGKENKIEDIGFYGEGCAISTATFSLLTQKIKGMKLEDAKKLSDMDIYKMIGLKVSQGRINCAMLPLSALKSIK